MRAARDARRAAREAAGSEVMEQGALSEAAQRMGAAILRYLAVAHYGRGRGDWVESEYPGHWRPLVAEVAARCRGELEPIWNAEGGTSADEVAQLLRPLLSRATREVLERLYPEASELFAEAIPNLGSGS